MSRHSPSLWRLVPRGINGFPNASFVLLVALVSVCSGVVLEMNFDESRKLSRDVLILGWLWAVVIFAWIMLPWAAMRGASLVLRVICEHVIADAAPPDSPREGSGLTVRVLTAAWIFPFVAVPFGDVPDNWWLWTGSTLFLGMFALLIVGLLRAWEREAMNSHQRIDGTEWRSVPRIRSDGDMSACNWVGAMLSVLFVPNLMNCVSPFVTGGRPSYVAWQDLDSIVGSLLFAFVPAALFSIIYPLSRAFIARQTN